MTVDQHGNCLACSGFAWQTRHALGEVCPAAEGKKPLNIRDLKRELEDAKREIRRLEALSRNHPSALEDQLKARLREQYLAGYQTAGKALARIEELESECFTLAETQCTAPIAGEGGDMLCEHSLEAGEWCSALENRTRAAEQKLIGARNELKDASYDHARKVAALEQANDELRMELRRERRRHRPPAPLPRKPLS